MTHPHDVSLSSKQLAALETAFHAGSDDASKALAKWIGRPFIIELDSLDQLPLEEATEILSAGEAPICFCSAEIEGALTGKMILAFDDASGLALSEMLLDQAQGTASAWTEMATSAALETTNILCCTYLNSLSRQLTISSQSKVLLPTPPKFGRDFAESLLEFVLMGQAIASDCILVGRTRFQIDDLPVTWTLLFVPDVDSMSRLAEMLSADDTEP